MHLSTLWNDDRYHPHHCFVFFFLKEDLPLKLLSAVLVPKWTRDIYPMNAVRITQNLLIFSDGNPSFKLFLSGSHHYICVYTNPLATSL